MQSRLRKRGRAGKWTYTHTIRKQVSFRLDIIFIYKNCWVFHILKYNLNLDESRIRTSIQKSKPIAHCRIGFSEETHANCANAATLDHQ